MSNNKNTSESFLSGALFGALVGVVAGILLAPEKGETTRKKLKSSYDEYSEKGRYLVDEASVAAQDLKLATRPLVEEMEARLAPVIERARHEAPAVRNELAEKIADITELMEDKYEDVKDDVRDKSKDLKKKLFKNA